MHFDAQKFKALVHYIIWRTSHRERIRGHETK